MRYCYLRFPEGKTKAVTFSYDDGMRSDILLENVITSYSMKCTFNINSANLGREGYLSKQELAGFLEHGHEIAIHGAHHIAPGALRPIQVIQEILEDRIELERSFDQIIRGMAYPDSGITVLHNGVTYDRIRENLTELGIVYARSLGGDNNHFRLPEDWYNWIPTAHHDHPQILDWAQEFTDLDVNAQYCALRYPRLFYLWGHAFEFENRSNWDRLDKICSVLAHKKDTWYATNMQIYEYTAAFNSLIFKSDQSLVYNPTLLQIWFDIDGALHTIKPGERLNLTQQKSKD